MLGHLRIVDGLVRLGKRNVIPQLLAAGKDAQEAAVVLGHVVAVQLFFRQAGIFEVEIVEHRVLNAGGGQVVTSEGSQTRGNHMPRISRRAPL
jgi:hypothetical protein